jgi:WD40 repeat protein
MIFFYAISSLATGGDEESHFMRGITTTSGMICVGTSVGSVVIFGHTGNADEIALKHTAAAGSVPVSALATAGAQLVCGDDNGDLSFFDSDAAFVELHRFPGSAVPITALVASDDIAVAGYSSGHIRIFRTGIWELAAEVTAHARCITGLDMSPSNDLFASCSEDQCLHIWSAPDFKSKSSSDVDLLFSERLENHLCTGLTFLSGGRIAVASYDSDNFVVFKKD